MSKIISIQRASYALIYTPSKVAFFCHHPSKSLSNRLWRRGRKEGNGWILRGEYQRIKH